jgi:hypothetical protein
MPLSRTPNRKLTLWIFALLYLLVQPVVEAIYYITNQSRGAYPVNADSIAIPIFQFTFGWLITFTTVYRLHLVRAARLSRQRVLCGI